MRAVFFIDKKAHFRLSVSVKLGTLTNVCTDLGNRAYLLCINCQSGGALFSYLACRDPSPNTEDTENGKLHFLFNPVSSELGKQNLHNKMKADTTTNDCQLASSPYIHFGDSGKYIRLPENISKIEDGAFLGLDLPTVLLPDGIRTIGRAAFLASEVENVALPDTLEVIEDDAFSGCRFLQQIFLPDSLTRIGARAFMGCESLREVYIPKSIKLIGDEAFAFCKNLKTVSLPEDFRGLGKDVFRGCPLNFPR